MVENLDTRPMDEFISPFLKNTNLFTQNQITMKLPSNPLPRRNANNLIRSLAQKLYPNGMKYQGEYELTPGQHIVVQALCNHVENNPESDESGAIRGWMEDLKMEYNWDLDEQMYILSEIPAPEEEVEQSPLEIAFDEGQIAAEEKEPLNTCHYKYNTTSWFLWMAGYNEFVLTGVHKSIQNYQG